MGDVIDLGDFQVLAKVDRRLEHREHVELDALVHLHYTAMLPYYTKLKAMLPEQARARYARRASSGGEGSLWAGKVESGARDVNRFQFSHILSDLTNLVGHGAQV